MVTPLLQSVAEYVGVTLRSLHVSAVAGEVTDLVRGHPVASGLILLGILIVGWLVTRRR